MPGSGVARPAPVSGTRHSERGSPRSGELGDHGRAVGGQRPAGHHRLGQVDPAEHGAVGHGVHPQLGDAVGRSRRRARCRRRAGRSRRGRPPAGPGRPGPVPAPRRPTAGRPPGRRGRRRAGRAARRGRRPTPSAPKRPSSEAIPPGASGASSGRCTPVATSTTTMCRYPRGPRRASTKRPSAETAVTERKPPRASVRCSPVCDVDEDDVGVRPVTRGDRADVVDRARSSRRRRRWRGGPAPRAAGRRCRRAGRRAARRRSNRRG